MRFLRYALLLLVFSLLLPPLTPTAAQGREGFSLWFWHDSTRTLLHVEAITGLTTPYQVTFPDGLQPPDFGLTISPTGQYLAYCSPTSPERVRQSQTFIVYDWRNQTVVYRLPLDNILYCGLGAGAWSPSGDEIALTLVNYDFTTMHSASTVGTAGEPPIEIKVINPLTQAITSPIPVSFLDSMTGSGVVYYRPGVELDVLDYGYEGPGILTRFDIQSGVGVPFSFPPNHHMLNRVETTGEFINPTYDQSISHDAVMGLGDPPYNVLLLHQNGATRPIYYQANGAIWNAIFMARGQSIALYTSKGLVLLDRNLNARLITVNPDEAYMNHLISTPYGVLVSYIEASAFRLVHYTPDGTAQTYYTEATAEPYYWRYIGGMNTGFESDLAPFPPFDLIAAVRANQPPECATVLLPRLRVDSYARVIDTTANNVRSGPSLSAERIGTIPTDGFFTILEGPVCADGFAFYKVDYEGLIGWTAEGQGDEYWIG